ncbi:unnamed protein product [Chondrus crispus]|uniref:Uncharacterized protein n=1 Tax=Chondrus crispus TaxID=2769 RepID=R7QBN7_CHOCR|nr:unnamed protein product [Chondrus crispus]CDF35198.1 unnamed protein product [Chondrus crispus]|eukprot:XP_005715017.1 unnamed protein product [Chondrus crispus]
MGKAKKALDDFIDNIPDSKLTGIHQGAGTLHTDTDFRLDLQGMTSGTPKMYNLQIQINRGTQLSTLKKFSPGTVSTVLAPIDPAMSAADIKASFRRNAKI